MNNYLSKIFLAILAVASSYFVVTGLFVIGNTEIVSGLFTLALLSIIVFLSRQHARSMALDNPTWEGEQSAPTSPCMP